MQNSPNLPFHLISEYIKYVGFGLDFGGDPKQSLMFMLGIRAHCVD